MTCSAFLLINLRPIIMQRYGGAAIEGFESLTSSLAWWGPGGLGGIAARIHSGRTVSSLVQIELA